MNRLEFMQKLNALLSGISESERQEALQYYNDYFDDAGFENEASVIEELESPEKVAATIKKDLGIEEEPVTSDNVNNGQGITYDGSEENVQSAGNDAQYGSEQYSNAQYSNAQYGNPQYGNGQYGNPQYNNAQYGNGQYNNMQYGNPQYNNAQGGSDSAPRKKTTAEIVLIVLLIIFASPLLIGAFGLVFGLICAAFGMVIGFGAAAVGLMIAGGCVFGVSIVKLTVVPAGGIMLMGISFILFGLGFFFWLATKGIVQLAVAGVRLLVDLCKKLFKNRGGCTA